MADTNSDRAVSPGKAFSITRRSQNDDHPPRSSSFRRSPARTPSNIIAGHRQSFSDTLRGAPASPRAHRQPSLGQGAVQELLNNPPLARKGDGRFSGRDWKTVRVSEVIDPHLVRFAELDTSVEEATNLLVSAGSPNVVLVRQTPNSSTAVDTFDYSDLNAYLLLVVGLAHTEQVQTSSLNELARKGREGKPIPLRDIKDLGRKEELISLPHTAYLSEAVELFGSGIHRIIIVKEGTSDAVGVLSQLRLVTFFWENGREFPQIDVLYGQTLRDLRLGSHSVLSINGDRPLSDALEMMDTEAITSLPVLDHHRNVVGNISHVDVRLLTKSTSLPLLRNTCIHFISVILSERGMTDGKDTFPVFYVSPFSSLAHTTAKLVATRSHRMWIVNESSPQDSAPPTPAQSVPPPSIMDAPPPPPGPLYPTGNMALNAGAPPGQHMSGRLTGVISLTDVLNLFARASGLSPMNPDEARRRRRNSSSSSIRAASIDSARSSTADLSRSGSVVGAR